MWDARLPWNDGLSDEYGLCKFDKRVRLNDERVTVRPSALGDTTNDMKTQSEVRKSQDA